MKAILLLSLVFLAFAGYTDENGCTGQTNTLPLIDTPPTLVKEVANGKKYTIGTFVVMKIMMAENSTLSNLEAQLMKWDKPMGLYSEISWPSWKSSSSDGLKTSSKLMFLSLPSNQLG